MKNILSYSVVFLMLISSLAFAQTIERKTNNMKLYIYYEESGNANLAERLALSAIKGIKSSKAYQVVDRYSDSDIAIKLTTAGPYLPANNLPGDRNIVSMLLLINNLNQIKSTPYSKAIFPYYVTSKMITLETNDLSQNLDAISLSLVHMMLDSSSKLYQIDLNKK